MRRCDVRTPEDALLYLTDCCLATVARMAMLKSRKKGEFERQISIAQTACDWLYDFKIDPKGTRAEDIVGKRTVMEWVEPFYSCKKPDSDAIMSSKVEKLKDFLRCVEENPSLARKLLEEHWK